MGDWTWVGQRGYGWLWSWDGIYPFLYREEDETWLWYDGGTNPRRFFNFTTEQWESLQP